MSALPVFGAFLEASGTILEKKILKKRNVGIKSYLNYQFLAIFLIMSLFIYFLFDVKKEAFLLWNISLFLIMILISVVDNFLLFYSLKREKISELEPIWLMQPLFTIILAIIFFGGERNWIIVSLGLIATTALVLSHVKKHHLKFNKYIIAALIGSFLIALELVISRILLDYYSPFSLYYIRSFFIFIAAFLIFRPRFNDVSKKTWYMISLTAVTWIAFRIILYYGYYNLGIVYTTILFALTPVFMILLAVMFLKERPNFRQIIATAVILVCVIAAVVIEN